MSDEIDFSKMTKKELIEFSRKTLALAKSREKDSDLLVLTEKAKSVCHISMTVEIANILKANATKFTDYVVSVSVEENPIKDVEKAEVVRVTATFKAFCRDAIIRAIAQKCE